MVYLQHTFIVKCLVEFVNVDRGHLLPSATITTRKSNIATITTRKSNIATITSLLACFARKSKREVGSSEVKEPTKHKVQNITMLLEQEGI